MRPRNKNDSITVNNNNNNNDNNIYDNNRSNWPFLDVETMEIYHERKDIISLLTADMINHAPLNNTISLGNTALRDKTTEHQHCSL